MLHHLPVPALLGQRRWPRRCSVASCFPPFPLAFGAGEACSAWVISARSIANGSCRVRTSVLSVLHRASLLGCYRTIYP